MSRVRVWLVRAAIVGAGLGAAACDAASTVGSPRVAGGARQTTSDGSSTMTMTTTTTTSTDTTATCKSGYQIAYRSDGSWYCVPSVQ